MCPIAAGQRLGRGHREGEELNDMTQLTGQRPAPEAVVAAIAELTGLFGNRCVTSQSVREHHAHTRTYLKPQAPDVVVFPLVEEEVVAAVQVAARHRLPIIPFGVGSSLEGHLNAPFGGVSIDTTNMKRIIAVHATDLDCVIEPGVTRKELNDYLRDQGLFFPVDPGADASIGGMVATRASGTNAVRYGTMKDLVLALRVVLANGDIVTTARRAKKTSAGYDLTRLFVGSEGTLGVITEITLRLSGIPEAISAATCSFPTVKAAADAASMAIQMGIPVARVELLDQWAVKATNGYSKLSLPETPLLLLEFHGSEASVKEQAEAFGALAEECGGEGFVWTDKAEDRTRLWQARHDAYWAGLSLRPGASCLSTDVCVPISRLAEAVDAAQADMAELGLQGTIVGHVGDGNFHVLPLFDPEDGEELGRVKTFCDRLVQRAIAMEGTCTGEHGVGQGKMKYLAQELGEPALEAMRMIKRAFDPDNLMNPGKILPM
jgi:D-lactate dehydrogenase (cytochrome)